MFETFEWKAGQRIKDRVGNDGVVVDVMDVEETVYPVSVQIDGETRYLTIDGRMVQGFCNNSDIVEVIGEDYHPPTEKEDNTEFNWLVGQRVKTCEGEEGEVVEVSGDYSDVYPIVIKFGEESQDYTRQGKYFKDYPDRRDISEITSQTEEGEPEKDDIEDPPVEDPPVEDPPVEDPPVEDPPVEDPPVEDLSLPGAKEHLTKPLTGVVLGDFAAALQEVVRVGTYGVQKYSENGWTHADPETGKKNYTDAMLRHYLAEAIGEEVDPETELLHASHLAWNALARLSFILKLRGKK